MKIKKQIKYIFGTAVFLAIAAVLLTLTTYVMRPTDKDFFRARVAGFYAEDRDSLDVVGFGSSALYRYLNSPLLWKQQGITSYGIATAAQPVYVIPSLIDEVKKTQSPQLYIIETRRFTDTDNEVIKENRLRQIADNMKVSWNRFKMVTELTEGFEDRLSYGFDLIKYHGNWENLTEESWEYLFNAKEHPLKGLSVNSRHKILSYLDVKDITGEIPITEKSEKELREIIEKCKKENLQVLFVATPWQVTEEEHQKDNYIKRIVEEAGFRFLDGNYYAEEMGLEYNVDFYNPKHTNAIGAAKFTTYLGNYIREHYDIKTDHSEEVAASWDKAAEKEEKEYEKAAEKILKKAVKAIKAAKADQTEQQ